MILNVKKRLGTGIYSIREAAYYARVHPGLMARWVFGNKKGRAVINAEYDPAERAVSFLDFVQAVAIREIRLVEDITLEQFRQAIEIAEKRGLTYPFAREHCTYWFPGIQELLILDPNEKPDQGYIQASGRGRGQRIFTFVESYLKKIEFGPDKLAKKYQIFEHHQTPIMMDPQIRFGEPMLPSGYSANAIFDSIKIDGLDGTIKNFGIPRKEAWAAYQFVNEYIGKTAA